MRRFSTALATLAFTVAAFGQVLDTKVTFSTNAASARNVLRGLSEATGVALEASPQTATEILHVKVKDVALGELMKRIAEVSHAEWRQEGSLYRLSRPASLAQAQAREELALRSRVFADRIADLTKGIGGAFGDAEAQKLAQQPPPALDGRPIRLDAARQLDGPAGRLLGRILKALRPEDLAAIPASTRVVFSNRPTRMQRPMPSAAVQAIGLFPREHEAWTRAASAAQGNPGEIRPFGPDFSAQPLQGPVGKVLLIVQRLGGDDNLSLSLRVYDAQGESVTQAGTFVSASTLQAAGSALAPTAVPQSTAQPVVYSDESREYAKLMTPGGPLASGVRMMVAVSQDGGGEPITLGSVDAAQPLPAGSVRNLLASPDQHEPLGILASPALDAAAEPTGLNVVASLPDALIPLIAPRVASGSVGSGVIATLLRDNLNHEWTEANGWLTVKATRPVQVREGRVDRLAFARLIKSVFSQGYGRLEDVATYALSTSPSLPTNSWDGMALRAANADAASLLGSNVEDRRTLLKLYATLGQAQRQALRNGAPLRIGTLAQNQHLLLSSLVFNSLAGPSVSLPRNDGAQVREERRVMTMGGSGQMLFSGGSDQNLLQERTEALPGGLPTDGFITLRVTEREAVLATPSNVGGPRFFTAMEYASYMATKDRQGFAPASGSAPLYTKFRPATVTDLQFQFQFAERVSMNGSLRDVSASQRGTDMDYGQLPASFRSAAEAAAQRVQQMLDNARIEPGRISIGGRGGGADRPPLP